ncbi:hypothetical protein MTR67_042689 [Solanum verrucosum]|uniref:Bifunctional inhibitor/plant lipid transfer protein/seed storage helical domain-containing protein n=1 Tax=Solanum verrucosum TaxID=315347 RepID=A0AAF0UQC7_SOLVR|nr:hypothetical protein MTR67_042689 [Solanum verrucosum]
MGATGRDSRKLYHTLIGGDFNIIMDEAEKLGGLPVTQMEIADFVQCTNVCALNEIKFKGSSYTWWNGRIEEESIFKSHDRVFGNNELMRLIPKSEVHHLIRTKHSEFKKVVEDSWNGEEINGNPFTLIHSKMKRIKFVLAQWNRRTFGDIFQRIATLEDTINVMEIQMEITPTIENRALLHKAEAELKKYRHIEEEFWRQMAGMKWFKEGDRNTKFFYAYVKGKMRKLQVVDILTDQRDRISTTQNIGEEAVDVFREKFRDNQETTNYDMLEYISTLINEEQNADMGRMPTEDEVKMVVFTLKGESTSGSDGFSRKFFQSCWDIVGNDMTNMVKAFFYGQDLPRIIRERIVPVLPGIISTNQSGFVKGRSITENVLLAQELVRDINMRNKLQNMVVKLDMAKTYDRSSRGLKQGDPLSLTMFIIATETKQGAHYYVEEDSAVNEELEVRSFSRHETWDIEGLRRALFEEMTVYIANHIKPPEDNHNNDAAWWMGNSEGVFAVKLAWNLVRHRKERRMDFDFIWAKGLPLKINFFVWRQWLNRISTDDNLKKMKIQIISRCWCCEVKADETMTHVFLTALITKRLWRHFSIFAGQTNAVIQCGTDVIPKVISCGGFILGDDAKPSQACCVGLQDLAKIASASQPDRKDICLCFKAAMQGSKVNYTKAKQLPDLCHFTPFMPMVPNPDCSKFRYSGSSTGASLIPHGVQVSYGQTNAVIQCDTDIIPKVTSCKGFVLGQDVTPSQECCVGLQDLAKIADASQPDRKDICLCLKGLMKGSPVNYTKPKQLPDLCHFTTFMPLEPNPDCSK